MNELQKVISFNKVSFSYDAKNSVLNEASFDIQKGEKVAIVGESGAGKSTIIDLLMGFQRPSGGKILIDQKNIEEISSGSIRNIMGYVPQKPTLIPNYKRKTSSGQKRI